jgi:hypothetical protein|tara:strand:- start:2526 stop:2720 length:195 start_codon:yes stop_codon:yes gene_type:complete
MKTYTLVIRFNEKTEELESIEERISIEEEPLAITASPEVMEKIDEANLIERVLVPYPGECVGEA